LKESISTIKVNVKEKDIDGYLHAYMVKNNIVD